VSGLRLGRLALAAGLIAAGVAITVLVQEIVGGVIVVLGLIALATSGGPSLPPADGG
jgi:hypothetical protein